MMKFFYSWLVVCALTAPASAQTPATLAEREAAAVVDNPLLSQLDSMRYLGTSINALAAGASVPKLLALASSLL
jgi:hypothetical protein